MILNDHDQATGGATLDELFRRAGVRSPAALALIDPPNRQNLDGAAPRKLTYAETNRLISVFAASLRALDLRSDAIVALQLANTVEGVIALLGVLRAGMIAAPLPLLWRQQEIAAALRGVGSKAIVTAGAVRARSAMLAAVELFPIRHICAFGPRPARWRGAARRHFRRRCADKRCGRAAAGAGGRACGGRHLRRHG